MDYKYHKCNKICDWKRRGLVLRQGETYEKFYELWKNTEYCQNCQIKLEFSGLAKNGRCLDHCHKTGYFRNILCNGCNHKRIDPKNRKTRNDNKTGIGNISRRVNGKYVDYCFQKTVNKKKHVKYFKNLEDAIGYKKEFMKQFD